MQTKAYKTNHGRYGAKPEISYWYCLPRIQVYLIIHGLFLSRKFFELYLWPQSLVSYSNLRLWYQCTLQRTVFCRQGPGYNLKNLMKWRKVQLFSKTHQMAAKQRYQPREHRNEPSNNGYWASFLVNSGLSPSRSESKLRVWKKKKTLNSSIMACK